MEDCKNQIQQPDKKQPQRKKWARKFEYVLSVLGFIVGFGNIWRFPYICMINGGGAFLIPYLVFLVLCGIPVFFIESILGQFTAKPVNKVWGLCPLLSGIGIGMLILQINGTVYYVSILGWILYYLYNSFKSPLPWSHCNNDWNTELCHTETVNTIMINQSEFNTSFLFNVSMYNNSDFSFNKTNVKVRSPAEEFWRRKVIQPSSGLSDLGGVIDHAAIATLVSCVVVFFCVIRGIRSVGKVVYVTALLPYILLLVILIRGLTLPGSLDGIIYYIKPDFNKLFDFQVWVQAGIQVFYSLGPGWGCLITMSSFNKFHNNCLRDTIVLAIAGEGTSVFGGFVVFSVLGFMAHEANVTVSEVIQTGPGLGLVAYPEALSQLPFPNVWACIFFLAMFTVGLDSTFGTLESFLDGLADIFPIFQKRQWLYRATIMIVFYLINLLYCTKGGIYFYQLTDWYCASVGNPAFVLMECIIVGWLYGTERFSRDIDLMIGRGAPLVMRICWCFITPFILLSLLVFMFATYKPPKYGDYEYPVYSQVIGWVMALSPLVPVIVVAVRTILRSPGRNFKEKIKWSIKPSEDWFPASDVVTATEYIESRYAEEERVTLFQRIKINTLGKTV